MIIEVVGLKQVSFKGTDGNQVDGINLYFNCDGKPNHIEGLEAGKLFISNQKCRDLGLSKIDSGSYELFYNRFGKVDFLKKI